MPCRSAYNHSVTGEGSGRRSAVTREAVEAALVETVATEHSIVAAFVFGSLARGTAGPLSDVDVGLLISDPRERGAVSERTMDALCRRLRTSRVDVVSLADAPLPVRYRVVRDGSLVACRDRAAVEQFVVEAVLQYLDFKPLRDQAFARMRQAVLESL